MSDRQSEYPIYDRDRKGVFGSVGGTNDYVEIDIPAGNMVDKQSYQRYSRSKCQPDWVKK